MQSKGVILARGSQRAQKTTQRKNHNPIKGGKCAWGVEILNGGQGGFSQGNF